jgi:hypothetical protein
MSSIPDSEAFLSPTLAHADALANRDPGVPLSGCNGTLVFRTFARPTFTNSPAVYRCTTCGDVLALDPLRRTVLWTERVGAPAVATNPDDVDGEPTASDRLHAMKDFNHSLAVARKKFAEADEAADDCRSRLDEAIKALNHVEDQRWALGLNNPSPSERK